VSYVAHSWLGNLLARQFEGRHSKGIAKTGPSLDMMFVIIMTMNMIGRVILVMLTIIIIRVLRRRVLIGHVSQ
jgi:hypothetical protein